MSEIDAYKIFRQLEERKKRENPYKFYDKDELIDEILKLEDKLQQKENIIKEVREYIDWHYDLGTEENVEFCLLRDRILNIIDKGE